MTDSGTIIIAIAILAIAFTGEPDLVDSIIYHLTGTQDGWMLEDIDKHGVKDYE